jgi:hypothetical protein
MVICKWCGKQYNKKHNRQMYCNEECSKESERENNNKRRIKYYHTYKFQMDEEKKYGLGSGFLGMHRTDDFNTEYEKTIKEKVRLKIV